MALVTVTADFGRADETPAAGWVSLSPYLDAVRIAPDPVMVTRAKIREQPLDEQGVWTAHVIASDDPGWQTSAPMPYRMEWAVSGSYGARIVEIPGPGPVDLLTVIDMADPPLIVPVPVPGPAGPPGADSTVPGPAGPPGADSTVPGPVGPPGEPTTLYVQPGPPALSAAPDGFPLWLDTDAVPTQAPAGPAPAYISGRWYDGRVSTGTGSGTAVTAGKIYYCPQYVYAPVTIQSVAVYVTTGGAASNVRIGLYTWDNGAPGARLYDWGTAATTSSSTAASITGLSVPLTPGWYFFALLFTGTPSVNAFTAGLPVFYGNTSATAAPVVTGHTETAAALPATATATPVTTATYAAFFRVT